MQSGDPLVDATLAGLKMIDKAMSDAFTRPFIVAKPVQDLDTKTVTDLQIAKYVAHGGIHCPACLSGDIVGDSFDVNEGYCTQEMSCSACGATWTDEYELTGVTDFKVGVESTHGGQSIEPSKS